MKPETAGVVLGMLASGSIGAGIALVHEHLKESQRRRAILWPVFLICVGGMAGVAAWQLGGQSWFGLALIFAICLWATIDALLYVSWIKIRRNATDAQCEARNLAERLGASAQARREAEKRATGAESQLHAQNVADRQARAEVWRHAERLLRTWQGVREAGKADESLGSELHILLDNLDRAAMELPQENGEQKAYRDTIRELWHTRRSIPIDRLEDREHGIDHNHSFDHLARLVENDRLRFTPPEDP